MKMVSATNGFIRLPFVVEGLVLGLVGGLVAFLLQWGLYSLIVSRSVHHGGRIITVLRLHPCRCRCCWCSSAWVCSSGVFDGLTAIRNFYLKV